MPVSTLDASIMTFFNAEGYEREMGRWSRLLASRFLEFVNGSGRRVLDVGCGTGSLALAVAAGKHDFQVVGIDPSTALIEDARKHDVEKRVRFDVGDAQKLPYPDSSFDTTMALLVVNFIPDPQKGVGEMVRVTRPGGTVAAAVWDYGDGMTMLRTFWDAAVKLDPAVSQRHARNMPFSRQGELSSLWRNRGLRQVEETGLFVTLDFVSFDDYFTPFLAGVGSAGSYAASLSPERQNALAEQLRRELLGKGPDRPFSMQARAWAVKGSVAQA
jgi:ubiquinone/menaquinone biosynthesis C-methylase UbiE